MSGKNLIEQQIEVFLGWGQRFGTTSIAYRRWLAMFSSFTEKRDILDVTDADVDLFRDYVYTEFNGTWERKQALISIKALIRFYMARSKNASKRVGRGRPPHIDQIAEAQRLKKEHKLSLSQIGKLLGGKKPLDKAQISRWLKYPLDLLKK